MICLFPIYHYDPINNISYPIPCGYCYNCTKAYTSNIASTKKSIDYKNLYYKKDTK